MKVVAAGSGVALVLLWGCSAAPGTSGANDDAAGGGANVAGEESGEEGKDKGGKEGIETSMEGIPVETGQDKPSVSGEEGQGEEGQGGDVIVDQGDALDQGDDVEGGVEGSQDDLAQQSSQDGVDQDAGEAGDQDQGDQDQVDQELVQQIRQTLAQDKGREIFLQDVTERFAAVQASLARLVDDAAREPFMERAEAIEAKMTAFKDVADAELEKSAVELMQKLVKLEKELTAHGDLD